jgi:hypothetical protein
MPLKTWIGASIGAAVGLCISLSAHAAAITFTNGTFTGNSIVSPTNEVYAENLGSLTTRVTGNGVTFWGEGFVINGYNYHFSYTASSHNNNAAGAFPSDTNFADVMNDADWYDTSNGTIPDPGVGTLTGLTPGYSYEIQLLNFDDNNSNAGRTFQASDGTNFSATQQYAFPYLNNNIDTGGYIQGTFTADSTSQTIDVTGSVDQLNGFVLYVTAVPEPASLCFLGIGMIAGTFRRRRQNAA